MPGPGTPTTGSGMFASLLSRPFRSLLPLGAAHGADAGRQLFAQLVASHTIALNGRGYAACTIANRCHHLADFQTWYEQRGLTFPESVTAESVERYREWLST